MIVPSYKPPEEEGRERLGRAVYHAVRDELEEGGMDPVTASRLALRRARLAVLRWLGFDQREAVELLAVSVRTGANDWQSVRAAIDDDGAIGAWAAREFAPVPVAADDRIVVRQPRRRGRGSA